MKIAKADRARLDALARSLEWSGDAFAKRGVAIPRGSVAARDVKNAAAIRRVLAVIDNLQEQQP